MKTTRTLNIMKRVAVTLLAFSAVCALITSDLSDAVLRALVAVFAAKEL